MSDFVVEIATKSARPNSDRELEPQLEVEAEYYATKSKYITYFILRQGG